MTERPIGRVLAAIGLVYLTQGVVWGLVPFVLLPTLVAAGASTGDQALLLAVSAVPWALKVVLGPVVDRLARGTDRRARLLVGGATVAIGLGLALLGLGQGTPSPGLVTASWGLVNLALALQDVTIDAIAIDTVPAHRRGRATGLMAAAHHVGAEGIGGFVLGWFVAASGLRAALLLVGLGLMVVAVVVPVLVPEAPCTRARGSVRDAIAALVASRASLRIAALCAVVFAADVVTTTVSSELLVDHLGWRPEDVARVLPPVLLVSTLAGYVLAARVSDGLGHARAAAIGSAGLGLAWLAFAAVPGWWPSVAFMVGFVVVQALVTALLYAGVHAMMMDAVLPSVRATHFALLTALANLARVWAPGLAPAGLAALGFAGLFAACGLAQLAIAWPLARTR